MPDFASIVLLLASLGASAGPDSDARSITLKPVARLVDPALKETSGIVASRRHPGLFWVHNDSGHLPIVFAVGLDGQTRHRVVTGVINLDWEDIATDDLGRLYLGDIGNNDRRLPIRSIYVFDEPEIIEEGIEDDIPPSPVLVSHYRFAAGNRFDAESLVIQGERALLISKRRDGREAEVYAVPLDPPAPLLRPAVPERIGSLPGFVEPATGADLSPDGRWLAVCSTGVLRVYKVTGDSGRDAWSLRATLRFQVDDPIEAICWDGFDLVLAGERGGLYGIDQQSWHAVSRTPESRGRR